MRIARALERLLLIGGAVLLGIWAVAFLHQGTLASLDRASFRGPRAQEHPGLRLPSELPGAATVRADAREKGGGGVAAYLRDVAPLEAGRLALLEVPAIDLEVVVLQGTGSPTLNRGVGHIEGTAMPGRAGNAGIAGHRDGFFRGLERVAVGDEIRITPRGNEPSAVYRIAWTRVVRPQDVWVLDPTEQPSLTLVTCHPFRFVGEAPDRYVVRAVRVPDVAAAR